MPAMRPILLLGMLLLAGCPGCPLELLLPSAPDAASEDLGDGGDPWQSEDAGASRDARVRADVGVALVQVPCTVPRPAQGSVPAECKEVPAGACATATDCASGLCLRLAGGARCTTACKDDPDCGAQERCRIVERLGEGYCVPKAGVAP